MTLDKEIHVIIQLTTAKTFCTHIAQFHQCLLLKAAKLRHTVTETSCW